ncbi:MAG: DNA polymerase III subunit delta [Chitinophagaceae bacterium]|nr:DNA polymerase III subunit delta [Chitinophagaceae bacterium]
MSAEKILNDWKNKLYKSVYWLEGEEEYFIDKVVHYAEHNILSESEASFNLSVFYGKDSSWSDVVNACMRYPMFADRQVVILKEGQQMRDIAKLEGYIEKPLKSTVFVISYKEKKVDGRSRLAKLLKEKGEMLSTKKLYENQLPEWTSDLVKSKGFGIQQKALVLLVDHIGNDLSRIDNEVNKLLVNIGNRKNITEEDVEKYVGVSKEYNPFELQNALAQKDVIKAMKIVNYFAANPKAAPIQLVLPTLYNLFSKTYMIFGQTSSDEKAVALNIGVSPFFVKDYLLTAKNYGYTGVENALLLLHYYNMRSVGVDDPGTSDGALMKELVYKITA